MRSEIELDRLTVGGLQAVLAELERAGVPVGAEVEIAVRPPEWLGLRTVAPRPRVTIRAVW